MDLLKYLEPMKNLPERFSNLAFWSGVRKLKDEVVSAFEYVDSWGDSIENKIRPKIVNQVLSTRTPNSNPATDLFNFKLDYSVGNKRIFVFSRVGGNFPSLPKNILPLVVLYLPYSYLNDNGSTSSSGQMTFIGKLEMDGQGNVQSITCLGNSSLTITDSELASLKNDWTSTIGSVQNSKCEIEYVEF